MTPRVCIIGEKQLLQSLVDSKGVPMTLRVCIMHKVQLRCSFHPSSLFHRRRIRINDLQQYLVDESVEDYQEGHVNNHPLKQVACS